MEPLVKSIKAAAQYSGRGQAESRRRKLKPSKSPQAKAILYLYLLIKHRVYGQCESSCKTVHVVAIGTRHGREFCSHELLPNPDLENCHSYWSEKASRDGILVANSVMASSTSGLFGACTPKTLTIDVIQVARLELDVHLFGFYLWRLS